LWRPDDIIILALLGVASRNGRAVLLIVGIATPTTATLALRVALVLAGGRVHGWLGISQLTLTIPLSLLVMAPGVKPPIPLLVVHDPVFVDVGHAVEGPPEARGLS
jgi:hypothetical protein